VATLFHAVWALVIAHTSSRDDVVFGTVLLGRLQGYLGGQRSLGVFINTLPLRLRLQSLTVRELVERTQRELIELLGHEQASLADAQRCSGMVGSAPLFSTLLNYRHSAPVRGGGWSNVSGIHVRKVRSRTNYPITFSVDDLGAEFGLTAQTSRQIDPHRVVEYVRAAMGSLVEALEQAPQTRALSLSILPEHERRQVMEGFNADGTLEYPGRNDRQVGIRQYEAPQGEVEEILAQIWQRLLRVEQVGREDDFFDLGGHSLLGMKLIDKVATRFGIRISIQALFERPTVRDMAELIA
jgi:acyl carrier protein